MLKIKWFQYDLANNKIDKLFFQLNLIEEVSEL